MGDTSQPTTDKIHSRKGSTGAGYYFSFFGGYSCPEYVTTGVYAVCFTTAAGKVFYNRLLYFNLGHGLL